MTTGPTKKTSASPSKPGVPTALASPSQAVSQKREAPFAAQAMEDKRCWLPGMRVVPSPNADERPAKMAIDTIILHYISLPPEHFSGEAVTRLFTNQLDCTAHPYFEGLAGLRVSSHFFLRRHGQLLQFVPPEKRAWHAGVSRLLDRERCNDFSIGIELEGSSLRPFTETQYRRLAQLIENLCKVFPIRHIAGHSDVSPGRKEDPGPYFQWSRLQPALERLGVTRPF